MSVSAPERLTTSGSSGSSASSQLIAWPAAPVMPKGSIRKRGRPQMGRGVLHPAEMGRAVGREGRGCEQRRPNVTQTAGQEAGTAQEKEANHHEPQDQGDPSVRPDGDGMEES